MVDEREQYGLPEYLRMKYMKLVNQNGLEGVSNGNLSGGNNISITGNQNNNDPNTNLIRDDDWQQDININQDMHKFLQMKQSKFLDLDLWESDQHEIVLRELGKDINKSYNNEMKGLLRQYRNKVYEYNFLPSLGILTDPILNEFNNERNRRLRNLVEDDQERVMIEKPKVDDLHKGAFKLTSQQQPNNFLTAMSCLINSDIEFQTNSLRRLIYPHRNNFPCVSPENVYFIKLFVNGARRSVPIDGKFDQGIYYTENKELYPFFIEKGLKRVYHKEELGQVLPNYLLYRMIGWIPEILHFADIGNCEQSYDKLKESFASFSVMLSFDYQGHILPILEFASDERNRAMLIKTILPDKKQDLRFINQDIFNLRKGSSLQTRQIYLFNNNPNFQEVITTSRASTTSTKKDWAPVER